MNAHVEIIDVTFVLRQIQLPELEAMIALGSRAKKPVQKVACSQTESDTSVQGTGYRASRTEYRKYVLFVCPSCSTAEMVSKMASSTLISVRQRSLKAASIQTSALSVSINCEAMFWWCLERDSIEQFHDGGRGAVAGQLGDQ
jgi:hypothetical protein|eukprot:COSAG03_NODE_3449_length_2003_cov_2.145483_1_plen_143_part_00